MVSVRPAVFVDLARWDTVPDRATISPGDALAQFHSVDERFAQMRFSENTWLLRERYLRGLRHVCVLSAMSAGTGDIVRSVDCAPDDVVVRTDDGYLVPLIDSPRVDDPTIDRIELRDPEFDPRDPKIDVHRQMWSKVKELAGRGVAVPVREFSDDVLTELLHHLAFQPGNEAVRFVTFQLDDATHVRFPVGAAAGPTVRNDAGRQNGRTEIRAALISMRHPEMDRQCDIQWFANRELQIGMPLDMVVEAARELSRTRWHELADNTRQPDTLYVCQTGLAAAVIGFYLAVLERGPARTTSVIPLYFRGDSWVEGSPW